MTTQKFQIYVATLTNANPFITSKPKVSISCGSGWEYQVAAIDPNGDPLTYSLDSASLARGITISDAGLITWTPAEVGKFDVRIFVDDGHGGKFEQSFTLDVTEQTALPEITSIPRGPAFVGEQWAYEITTDQPAGTYELKLDTDSISRGIVLDGNIIRWTPTAIGGAQIKITLIDQNGNEVTQSFTITAQAKAVVSYPPTITSKPFGPAYVGEEWSYQITATDPANHAITYSVLTDDGNWKTLDSGILLWMATEVSAKRWTVRAENEHGAWTEQSFTLSVVEKTVHNNPPVITSIPTGPTLVGDIYLYQVIANDIDNDVLTYFVDDDSFANGITIDENGLLQWQPTIAGTQTITITVTDQTGDGMTQTFELAVIERPTVLDPPTFTSKPTGPAYINEAWSYALTATSADGGAVTFYLVSQDDGTTTRIIDGNLQLTWDTAGTKPLIIRAVDSNDA